MNDRINSGEYTLGINANETAKKSFYRVASRVNKSELLKFITELGIEIDSKLKKEELLNFICQLSSNQLIYFTEKHKNVFALYPNELEEFLGCSHNERKRWQEEGKLKIIEYREFDYGEFPVYDCLDSLLITPKTVEQWRKDYQEKVAGNRSRGAKKAQETHKLNSVKKQIFKFQYEEAITNWKSRAADAIGTLKLAYWTMYLSRLAKYFQFKAINAIKYEDVYRQKSQDYYELKNKAIAILVRSPYAELGYYIPSEPDKISYYYYWSYPNEINEERFYRIVDYRDNGKVQVEVEVNRQKNYYCLYYLCLRVTGIEETFSFHTPKDIGDKFFPPGESLPLVDHEESEGLFRFGRPLNESELVTHTEKVILKYFEESLTTFEDDFVEDSLKIK